MVILCSSCSTRGEAESLYVKASDFYAKQELEKALEYTNQALKKDSAFYQASLLKAKVLYFTDDYKSSEKILKKLVKKYPQFSEARIWKIRLFITQNKFLEAEKLLKDELSFSQTDWRIYYLYSVLANKMEQMDMRLSMCRKAIDVLSDSEKAYIEMADLWIILGMREHALDELDKAELVSAHADDIRFLKQWVESGKDIR